MGLSVSHAAAPTFRLRPPPPFAAKAVPLSKPQEEEKEAAEEKVDYMNLPCPVPYEEIQREAFMVLKPELFEGVRFDFTKGLSQYFALSHSVFMGSIEVPSQRADVIKVPTSNY